MIKDDIAVDSSPTIGMASDYMAVTIVDGSDLAQMAFLRGVTSVAAGIESGEPLWALRRLGCGVGKGYLLTSVLEFDAAHQRFGVGLVSAS